MNDRALRVLEYNKIISELVKYAVCDTTVQKIEKLRPISDVDELNEMAEQVQDAVDMIRRNGSAGFIKVNNILPSLARCASGSMLNQREVLSFGRLLRGTRLIREYYAKDERQMNTSIDGFFEALEPDKRLEREITEAILSEEEIADNASNGLLLVRQKMRNAEKKIQEILQNYITSPKYQKILQDGLITNRGGRYVIPVKSEHKGEVNGIVHDTSSSGATLFIEPISVIEQHNKLNELKGQEEEEIEKILWDFTAKISEQSDILKLNFELYIKLDFLFAKAKYGMAIKASTAKLNGEGITKLKNARHPLIDPQKVVGVDISLGDGFDTLVITGPNTGGKTVALKTIGLFTLMAQSGLMLPCREGSEIGVYEEVFADIGDEQSIEQSLSTFSSHMKNIVEIVEQADEKSLCLFDELGAGTDPTEGAALAQAIIERVRSKGAKSAVTTHYAELKLFALSTEGVINGSCEFDVKTLRPTYKLIIGIPGKSNAFEISKKLGLPEEIIQNAVQLIDEDSVKFEDIIGKIYHESKQAERERENIEKLRNEINLIRKTVEAERRKLEQEREKVIERAQEQAKDIVAKAKDKSNEILDEIKELQKKSASGISHKEMVDAKTKINRELSVEQKVKKVKKGSVRPQDLKAGDTVYVNSLEQNATVLSLPNADHKVQVMAGIIKMHVDISDLAKVKDAPKSEKDYIKNRDKTVSKVKSAKTELDLRGYTLDDALVVTEKFIDDAYLSHLSSISIIHGKGTGVLRSGIHQYLKKDKRVKNFRLGAYGEGDSGVTICEL